MQREPKARPARRWRPQHVWYALMAAGGLAFGLVAERRPFGEDVLAHPLVVFFAAVGVGLLVLRALLARPVPQLLSERRAGRVPGRQLDGAAADVSGRAPPDCGKLRTRMWRRMHLSGCAAARQHLLPVLKIFPDQWFNAPARLAPR
jgi:hypothetical protein